MEPRSMRLGRFNQCRRLTMQEVDLFGGCSCVFQPQALVHFVPRMLSHVRSDDWDGRKIGLEKGARQVFDLAAL